MCSNAANFTTLLSTACIGFTCHPRCQQLVTVTIIYMVLDSAPKSLFSFAHVETATLYTTPSVWQLTWCTIECSLPFGRYIVWFSYIHGQKVHEPHCQVPLEVVSSLVISEKWLCVNLSPSDLALLKVILGLGPVYLQRMGSLVKRYQCFKYT